MINDKEANGQTRSLERMVRRFMYRELTYLDRAFQRGRRDYRAGKPPERNPYRRGCPRAALQWKEGYERTKAGDEFLRATSPNETKLSDGGRAK